MNDDGDGGGGEGTLGCKMVAPEEVLIGGYNLDARGHAQISAQDLR